MVSDHTDQPPSHLKLVDESEENFHVNKDEIIKKNIRDSESLQLKYLNMPEPLKPKKINQVTLKRTVDYKHDEFFIPEEHVVEKDEPSDSVCETREQNLEIYNPVVPLTGKKDGQAFIKLKCNDAKSGFIKLIVDSGSEISLIKLECLTENTKIHPEQAVKLQGIASTRQGAGVCYLHLCFGKKWIPVDFQGVAGAPPEEADGLLGKNVLRYCVLNFPQKSLTLYEPDQFNKRKLKDLFFSKICMTAVLEKPGNHSLVDNKKSQCTQTDDIENPVTTGEIADGDDEVIIRDTESEQNLPLPHAKTSPQAEKPVESEDQEVINYVNNLAFETVEIFLTKTQVIKSENSDRNEPRVARILSQFGTSHLGENQNRAVTELVTKYSEVFKLEGDKLPATTALKVNVPLKTDVPLFKTQYQLSAEDETVAFKQALKWKEEGVVRESVSSYNHPILVRPKKGVTADGTPKKRTCSDLRALNEIIVD